LLACFLVIINHHGPYVGSEQLGHAGVGLFFSISGYLIGTILLSEYGKRQWMSLFYAKRLLRIYPAYLTALVFFGALLLTGAANSASARPVFFDNLFYYLTFTTHFSPADDLPFGIVWSLCVEEFFYLLLPVVFLLGSRFRVMMVLAALVILTMEPRVEMFPGTNIGTWFVMPANLFGGALLALYKPRVQSGLPITGFIGVGILLFNAITGTFHAFGPIMATVTTLTVMSFAMTKTPFPRHASWMLFAGKLSYGVYLIHLPVCSLSLRIAQQLSIRQWGDVAYFGFASVLTLVVTVGLVQLLMVCQVSLIPLGITYAVVTRNWDSLASGPGVWLLVGAVLTAVVLAALSWWGRKWVLETGWMTSGKHGTLEPAPGSTGNEKT
jgi:peptidoglycan/LPS O-acetylase OafA/YrhL